MSEKKRSKFTKFLLYGKSFGKLFIAHHPECDKFGKSHTINIGKLRFCIGCFVGYTAAVLTLVIIYNFGLDERMNNTYLLIFGVIFIGSFILSPLNLTKVKIIKIIQKSLIGVGSAFIIVWIGKLPNPKMTNILISVFVTSFLISILNIYHAFGFYRTCYKCETPFDWGNCPGFKSTRSVMEKHNLSNFLINLESFSEKILEKRKLKNKS